MFNQNMTFELIILVFGAIFPFISKSWYYNWEEEFEHSVWLDNSDEEFKLYWSHDNDTITFGIEAHSMGWIALGISPTGQMPGSDIFLGWIDNDEVYIQDMFAPARRTPLLDDQQDLDLIEGEQYNGWTRIKFSRNKFLCNLDDLSIDDSTTRLIFALNNNNIPIYGDTSSIWIHELMGSQSLNTDLNDINKIDLDFNNLDYIDIKMDNYVIPTTDTTYFCKTFELPQFDTMQQVVMYEAIITPENEGLVHHMLFYECTTDDYNHTIHSNISGICDNNPRMPPCNYNIRFGTGLRSRDFYYPSNVGVEMGVAGTLQYGILEIHYDNQNLIANKVDSSGFRIWYTSQLREYSADAIALAIPFIPYQFLPPGMDSIINYGYCTAECTQHALPDDGIKIFAASLHAHTSAYALRLRHIRNNKELKPIDKDWKFDFNYQRLTRFHEEIIFLPGDTLILECYYNTSDRDNMTFGGDTNRDEMCLVTLNVYPASNLVACGSILSTMSINKWDKIAKQNGYINMDGSLRLKDYVPLKQLSNPDAQRWSIDTSTINYKWIVSADNFYQQLCAYSWYKQLWHSEEFNMQFQSCITKDDTPLECEHYSELYDYCLFDVVEETNFEIYKDDAYFGCETRNIEYDKIIQTNIETNWDSSYCIKNNGKEIANNEMYVIILVSNVFGICIVLLTCLYYRKKMSFLTSQNNNEIDVTGIDIDMSDSETEIENIENINNIKNNDMSDSETDIDMSDSESEIENIENIENINNINYKIIPINLCWQNITFSTPNKIIFSNINGNIESGKLTAILGPSGAGKTSLLNLLAQQLIYKKDYKLSGKITVNGFDLYKLGNKYLNLIGYIKQTEELFKYDTVYETLMTATIFNANITTIEEQEHIIENVLIDLDLLHVKNSKIHDISGGEMKRVCIGIQLIKSPSILLLDEPTSGLSGFQALKIIKLLKKLCKTNGCTIVISIHQPRSQIFELLNNVILLSCNGNVIYCGKTDKCTKYFAQNGYICPSNYNPCDYLIDLISKPVVIKKLIAQYKQNKKNDYIIDENNLNIMCTPSPKMIPMYLQMLTLIRRSFRQFIRDKKSLLVRIVSNIIVTIIMGILFYHLTGASVMEKQSVFFMMSLIHTYGPASSVKTFSIEKQIMIKETKTNSYTLLCYYLSTFITIIPKQIIFPIVSGSIIYWIIGLKNNIYSFLIFLFITVITNFTGIAVGLICSAGLPSISAAGNMAVVIQVIYVLFSGFLIRTNQLPMLLQKISMLSPLKWEYTAFCINEFKHEQFTCDDNNNNSDSNGIACFLEGEDILSILELDQYTVQFAIIMIIVLFFSLHLGAFILLKINTPKYMKVK